MEVSESIFHSPSTKIRYITPKVSRRIDIDLVSYFQPWINFCYYLLFVPFKIEHNGSSFFIRTNKFQKILCGILHPIVWTNSYFEFHEKFTDKVRGTPDIFMRALDRFNTILVCFVFFYTVWFRKHTFGAIFNDAYHTERIEKVKRKALFCCVTILSLSVFSFVALTFGIESYNWSKGFQHLIQKFRFAYYFTDRLTIETPDVPITPLTVIAMSMSVLLRLYKWMLLDFITSLTLMIGFVSYKICAQFKLILMNSDGSELRSDDGEVMELNLKLKTYFNKLNDLFGPILVTVFLFTTISCAVNATDALDSDEWSPTILLIFYLSLQFLALVFIAEAHYQASYFKTWLLLQYHNGGSKTNLTGYLLEVEQCNLAVKGGRCFTITYSFLGTASSVVLTYAIIMLQFGGGKSTLNCLN